MNKKQNSKQKIQKLAENDARPERAIQPTELLNDTLRRIFGCELADATQKQVYRALCISVRELLTEKNRVFGNRCTEKERKEVYYMSMEFLVGTSLRNNLFNLGLEAEFRKALADAGFDIDEIYAIDPDAGLGNGGLGRLASCYMDAATGMDYPMTGFSIRYEFGIFKQKIVDGWQMEFPDNWLEMGDVWLQAREDDAVEVKFGGEVREWMDNDRFKVAQVGYSSVMAVPYDMYISGYDSDAANRLVLWSAKLPQSFDMAAFSRGDYVRALERNAMAETISKVLYPADDHIQGKRLRLKQQYLLVSASLQSILKKHYKKYRTYTNLPEKVAIHINDTHPALCVPELMRLLIDEHDFGWDEAWDITCRTLSYTNHTVMSEALERWNVDLFREQLHIPFQDYLARLRLEAAMLLLRQSDTTLTDAAYACGFSDPKYLNRSFQKNLGMSPRQWLQENRPAPTGETQSKEDSRTAQHILTPDECRALLGAYGIMPDQIFRIFSSSPLA